MSRICTGEEDALSPEALARISELEQALASNPFNYANHEELVKLLKGGEDFDRLDHASNVCFIKFNLVLSNSPLFCYIHPCFVKSTLLL